MARPCRSNRNRTIPSHRLLFEPLELRCLFSVSLAHLPTPHYYADYPFPQMVTLASLKDLPAGSTLTATINWDNNPNATEASVNPTSDTTADIFVGSGYEYLPDDPGLHTAHLNITQTDPSGNTTTLHFDVQTFAGANSPNGRTLTLATGEEFSGVIGTIPGHLQSPPPQPLTPTPSGGIVLTVAPITGNIDSYTIYWGDGTASAPSFSDNGNGTSNVLGDHTYANPGYHQITVTELTIFNQSGPGIHSDIFAAWRIVLESSAIVFGDPVHIPQQPPPPGQIIAPVLSSPRSAPPAGTPSNPGTASDIAVSPPIEIPPAPIPQATPAQTNSVQPAPSDYHFEQAALTDDAPPASPTDNPITESLDQPLI